MKLRSVLLTAAGIVAGRLTVVNGNDVPSDNGGSHIIPQAALSNGHNAFNVTGPLNSFVEQLEQLSGNSQPPSAAQSESIPVVQLPNLQQHQQPPVSAFHPNQGIPLQWGNMQQQQQQQPQPHIQMQPPVGPVIDPALQRLLSAFGSNADAANQRVLFEYATAAQPAMLAAAGAPPTTISYVTCYVGCSHVTNYVTSSATPLHDRSRIKMLLSLQTALLFTLLFL